MHGNRLLPGATPAMARFTSRNSTIRITTKSALSTPAPGRDVIVGLEASGYSQWFEALLAALGHQSWVGETCEIRRRARSRQKNDRRDAELILDLLLKDEFPRVHRLTEESLEVLRRLRDRHRLVKMRTQASNALYAIALNAGSSRKAKLLSRAGRERLQALSLSPVQGRQREQWLGLIDQFSAHIAELERELESLASRDERVGRLRTHPGIGLLTGLALVHTLSPVGPLQFGAQGRGLRRAGAVRALLG